MSNEQQETGITGFLSAKSQHEMKPNYILFSGLHFPKHLQYHLYPLHSA